MSRYPVESGGNRNIPDTFVFTGERSRKGYGLNKFAMSLTNPGNREAFCADEGAYMDRYHLTEQEKAMVGARDWDVLIQYGGNIYIMVKIAGTLGISLLAMGAQMRGQSLDAFMATRPGTSAKVRKD